MTLPSRKKHPTIAPTIPSQANRTDRSIRTLRPALKVAGRSVLALALFAASTLEAQAQNSSWQPTRLPNNTPVRQLPNANSGVSASQPAQAVATNSRGQSEQTVGSGVVLRWRTSAHASNTPAPQASAHEAFEPATTSPGSVAAGNTHSGARVATSSSNTVPASYVEAGNNPLRSSTATTSRTSAQLAGTGHNSSFSPSPSPHSPSRSQPSAVAQAAYQQTAQNSGQDFGDVFGGPRIAQAPSLPQGTPAPMPQDALSLPEAAPAPGTGLPDISLPPAQPLSPLSDPPAAAPRTGPRGEEWQSPFDRVRPEGLEPRNGSAASPSDNRPMDDDRMAPNRRGSENAVDCDAIRQRLRNSPLSSLDLNTAPRFGEGMGTTREEAEKKRLDFAASSEVRQWCTREGATHVTGRMIDLRNDAVVLDINGARREIPLRDLCDADLAYVGKAWNLPSSCGAAVDAYNGRSFIASAMEWKAPGLCHKPLYFEEVQLERYGHEVGPVLQPIISSAHFFGNIAVLPYKMGIHPPTECQYALGYYRPGECAPYMLPPIPISLRGAAAQAGAVIAGAAIIP